MSKQRNPPVIVNARFVFLFNLILAATMAARQPEGDAIHAGKVAIVRPEFVLGVHTDEWAHQDKADEHADQERLLSQKRAHKWKDNIKDFFH